MEKVCVTGGGGYVASWVVKYLLSKGGYTVHATVRDPSDEKKNGHLKNLGENLRLFKADLFDNEGLCNAFEGCTGVFHVASPVPSSNLPNPEVEVIEPAVTGTKNVMKACIKAKVNKVVFVSSAAAVAANPNWPKDQPMDETSWSDPEYCKANQNWYLASKTLAEREALGYAERNELNVVSVCPTLVLGPMLQSTVNASSAVLLKYMKGGSEAVKDDVRVIVDVRDVAEAILLAYEKPEAEGRYICMSHAIRASALIGKLEFMFPTYNYPKSFIEVPGSGLNLSNQKLQNLGWKYRPLEETVADAVTSYRALGLLDEP